MSDLVTNSAGRSDVTSSLFNLDPDYFSLSVRLAFREQSEPDVYLDDCLAGVSEPSTEYLLQGERLSVAESPEVVEAGLEVADAEAAVLRAEDAGVTDELAMRRLDKARAGERAVFARLQWRRAVAHTERAVSRSAQVVPMQARLRVVAGGEAA